MKPKTTAEKEAYLLGYCEGRNQGDGASKFNVADECRWFYTCLAGIANLTKYCNRGCSDTPKLRLHACGSRTYPS